MIARKTAERYLKKWVGIERTVDGKTFFSKGFLDAVSGKDVVLVFRNKCQSASLDSIDFIRELDEHERR